MKTNIHSRAFTYAWALFRVEHGTFSECLTAGWARAKAEDAVAVRVAAAVGLIVAILTVLASARRSVNRAISNLLSDLLAPRRRPRPVGLLDVRAPRIAPRRALIPRSL